MNLKAAIYTILVFLVIIIGGGIFSKKDTSLSEKNDNSEYVEEKKTTNQSQSHKNNDNNKAEQNDTPNISYHTFDQVGDFPFYHGLYAIYNKKKYTIINGKDQDYSPCISIFNVKDYDGDGLEDALIVNIVSCGGNCCPTTFFFCTYSKNGKFIETEEFGSSWGDPIIEKWKGNWSVIVVSEREGVDITEMSKLTERYILKNKKAVRVEYEYAKPIQAILEMTSDSFTEREKRTDVGKKIAFDLDNDGMDDIISGEYWGRWGRMLWKIKFADGKKFESSEGIKRIGILSTKTNGVNDIVLDFYDVMVWDGKKYVARDSEYID